MPRAYVVPRAEPVPKHVAEIRARFRVGDPRAAVLMTTDPLGPTGTRQPFTPGEWLSTDPDRVAVRVTTRAPGLLVIADTWMPGWSARVNGRPAPIYRGNHAQRVVPLREAGTHMVEMSYAAPGLARGAIISAASALIWAVVGLTFCVAKGESATTRPNVYPAPKSLRFVRVVRPPVRDQTRRGDGQ
jgi:hypothetical protein